MDTSYFKKTLRIRIKKTTPADPSVDLVTETIELLINHGMDPMDLVDVLHEATDLIVETNYSNEYYLRYLSYVQNVAQRTAALYRTMPELYKKFGLSETGEKMH